MHLHSTLDALTYAYSQSALFVGAGYALSIYIPVALLCVIRIEILRWALIGAATLTSGLFLMMNFRGPIFESAGAKYDPPNTCLNIATCRCDNAQDIHFVAI